jgi:hypothetical protein
MRGVVLKVQSVVRGWLCRINFARTKAVVIGAAVMIQATWRRYMVCTPAHYSCGVPFRCCVTFLFF